MKLENYCIYVNNYSEWIELQKYLFELNVSWLGEHRKKLYTTWKSTNKEVNILFPRNLLLYYNDEQRRWCMANNENYEGSCLSNDDKYTEIKAVNILRKNKLKQLENDVRE